MSNRTLLAYGAPILGISYLFFFVQFYFLKFATDVLLLPPAAVGALFALGKLWDSITNPVVGSWSDRCRSRWGRRRPFLVGALPLLIVGFVMLWRPPLALEGGLLLAWTAVAMFIFFGAYALYTIPHLALGAELSSDSHQRTRLFGARQISFTIGMLVAFVAIQAAMNAAEPRTLTGIWALPAVLVGAAILAITPFAVAEPKSRGSDRSLVAGLRDVLASRPARLLLTVWFIESFGVGAVGTMTPYVAEYVLHRPDIVGTLPAAYVISGVLSIPVWVRVSRGYGARETWLIAMLLAAAAFGGMMFVGPGQITQLMILLLMAGCAMGCGSVLAATITADLIDLDEKTSGERKEGVYSSAMMFALKVGGSAATALSGLVLDITGFVPNVEQSAESLLGIRLLFAGLPCVGFLTGAMLFRGFPKKEG